MKTVLIRPTRSSEEIIANEELILQADSTRWDFPTTQSLHFEFESTYPDGSNIEYQIIDFPTKGLIEEEPDPGLESYPFGKYAMYVPFDGEYGDDQFTFQITDGVNTSNLATVKLRMVPVVEQPPWVIGDGVQTDLFEEDTISVYENHDPEYSVVLAEYTNQRVLGVIQEGPWYNIYTDIWWYRVLFTDEVDGWVEAQYLQDVAFNFAPTALTQSLSTKKNTALSITLSATDQNNDTLTYTIVDSPAYGVISGTPPNVTYTPLSNVIGTDYFNFIANDGVLDSSPATINIQIKDMISTPVNISRTGWEITASSQEVTNENSPITNAKDGSNNTFWHTKWSSPAATGPHWLAVDMGEEKTFDGFSYLPRQDGGANGILAGYEFYVSNDSVNLGPSFDTAILINNGNVHPYDSSVYWGSPVKTGTLTINSTLKQVLLDAPVTGRYAKLLRTSSANNTNFFSCAEFNILKLQEVENTTATTGSTGSTGTTGTTGTTATTTPPIPGTVVKTRSITKNEITWTFSEELSAGQYCNGDWFVVTPSNGTVTIISINPTATIRRDYVTKGTTYVGEWIDRYINGTVVNQFPRDEVDPYINNGFDSANRTDDGKYISYMPYSGSVNVAPGYTGQPLICSANTSIISSISKDSLQPLSHPKVSKMATLTVVPSIPPSGSFRPPPFGTDKAHNWNKSQLNYSILQSVTLPSSKPSFDYVLGLFKEQQTTFYTGNAIQYGTPEDNPQRSYGQWRAQELSDAMFWLHSNELTESQKEPLYIALVQYGIDIYGFLRDGGSYRGSGGLNCGFKLPLVLAALALNDDNLKEWASGQKYITAPKKPWKQVRPFLEDSQLWVVKQSDVGRATYTADGRPRGIYEQQHVGLPEWGSEHEMDQVYDGPAWNAYYRAICGSAHVSNALAAKMLVGGEALWNNSVFFDYYLGRYWKIEGSGTYTEQTVTTNNILRFHFDMLKLYNTHSYTLGTGYVRY